MTAKQRFLLSLAVALWILPILILLTARMPVGETPLGVALFLAGLLVFTTTFGIRLAGGQASLLPMMTASCYLIMGLSSTIWVAYLAAGTHGAIRYVLAERLGTPKPDEPLALPTRTAVNMTMHTASILVGALLFEWLGGQVPFVSLDGQIIPLFALAVGYFVTNYLVAGIYLLSLGPSSLWAYGQRLPIVLLYEGTPMLLVPLIVMVYVQVGLSYFILIALALIVVSLITYNLDKTRQRLERRVQELRGLQAVGQALSASLDLNAILTAVYEQLAVLMPVETFYIALYESKENEITFPLFINKGETKTWPTREMGNGLTEYVLRTQQPLLIQRNMADVVTNLGINHIGPVAASWLGVPMIAGNKLIGVIATQSLSHSEVYDEKHQEVLLTIAAQAALAIQNARLFTQVDSELMQRAQELDSIFRAAHDGILLLNENGRILAANHAFATWFGFAPPLPTGQSALTWPNNKAPLLIRIGYTPSSFEADCQMIMQGKAKRSRRRIQVKEELYLERTLTAVYGHDQTVIDWLLVFRDISDELELELLRHDMTHMLVHDLRSPLSVTLGSLRMSLEELEAGQTQQVPLLLSYAEQSSERMMRLINNLMDIYEFESGEVPLQPVSLPVRLFLTDGRAQFHPLSSRLGIKIDIDVPRQVPPLLVDSGYLGRVLYNLLDNALKFTPDDGYIRLWAKRDEQEGMIRVGISDSGPGISPEIQNRLFQKFQKGEGGRQKGSGLGLTFCRLVVEAHKGEIWVESIPGEGATFVMRLPSA